MSPLAVNISFVLYTLSHNSSTTLTLTWQEVYTHPKSGYCTFVAEMYKTVTFCDLQNKRVLNIAMR